MPPESYQGKSHSVFFGYITILAIAELSISALVVARFNSHHNYDSISERDRIRYVLLASCWTVFFCSTYIILVRRDGTRSFMTSASSHGTLFISTWFIWAAAAIAITELLARGLHCSVPTKSAYCPEIIALQSIAWIILTGVTSTIIFIMYYAIRYGVRSQQVSA